jgi:hypothetical protein
MNYDRQSWVGLEHSFLDASCMDFEIVSNITDVAVIAVGTGIRDRTKKSNKLSKFYSPSFDLPSPTQPSLLAIGFYFSEIEAFVPPSGVSSGYWSSPALALLFMGHQR